jgi:hypothetical protein
MDNMHKPGEEVKKLPQDPGKIQKVIALRAKALMAKIVEKLKK